MKKDFRFLPTTKEESMFRKGAWVRWPHSGTGKFHYGVVLEEQGRISFDTLFGIVIPEQRGNKFYAPRFGDGQLEEVSRVGLFERFLVLFSRHFLGGR